MSSDTLSAYFINFLQSSENEILMFKNPVLTYEFHDLETVYKFELQEDGWFKVSTANRGFDFHYMFESKDLSVIERYFIGFFLGVYRDVKVEAY